MKIDFEDADYLYVPGLNGGKGEVGAKMHFGNGFKVIKSIIPAGASIGMHTHNTSIDFNYVISGNGLAVCDGVVETLGKGDIHCCPLGSAHSIENTGNEDLVLITFVPELNKTKE